MKTLLHSLTLIVAVASVGRAEDLPEATVDFRNDLIPMFTKHGCNASACHDAAIGRGGFKLSLYGSDPKSDFEAVVRQMNGRRVKLSNPEESLILLKPAEHVEHGGGAVIDDEGDSAQLLIAMGYGTPASNMWVIHLQRTFRSYGDTAIWSRCPLLPAPSFRNRTLMAVLAFGEYLRHVRFGREFDMSLLADLPRGRFPRLRFGNS